ncbi:MAG: hypothetical protein QM734_15825 [Cyclobacteriaceae bacterium]
MAKAFEQNQIAWGVAVLASLLTVILYVPTVVSCFLRKGDEQVQEMMHHIHESPKTMTIPLDDIGNT